MLGTSLSRGSAGDSLVLALSISLAMSLAACGDVGEHERTRAVASRAQAHLEQGIVVADLTVSPAAELPPEPVAPPMLTAAPATLTTAQRWAAARVCAGNEVAQRAWLDSLGRATPSELPIDALGEVSSFHCSEATFCERLEAYDPGQSEVARYVAAVFRQTCSLARGEPDPAPPAPAGPLDAWVRLVRARPEVVIREHPERAQDITDALARCAAAQELETSARCFGVLLELDRRRALALLGDEQVRSALDATRVAQLERYPEQGAFHTRLAELGVLDGPDAPSSRTGLLADELSAAGKLLVLDDDVSSALARMAELAPRELGELRVEVTAVDPDDDADDQGAGATRVVGWLHGQRGELLGATPFCGGAEVATAFANAWLTRSQSTRRFVMLGGEVAQVAIVPMTAWAALMSEGVVPTQTEACVTHEIPSITRSFPDRLVEPSSGLVALSWLFVVLGPVMWLLSLVAWRRGRLGLAVLSAWLCCANAAAGYVTFVALTASIDHTASVYLIVGVVRALVPTAVAALSIVSIPFMAVTMWRKERRLVERASA